MPARSSVVKVLTPPYDDAVVKIATDVDGDVLVEDATFDAFKAVPVSERRLSQQANTATRGGPGATDAMSSTTTSTGVAVPTPQSSVPSARGGNGLPPSLTAPWRMSGMSASANGPTYSPPVASRGPHQPFLVQAPPPMNRHAGPTYASMHSSHAPQQMPQQLPPGRPMTRTNGQGHMSGSANGGLNGSVNGSWTHLPEILPARQPSAGSGYAHSSPGHVRPSPRTAQPVGRPSSSQPPHQQRVFVVPDNGAAFMPDRVEEANQRFKEAKQKSFRRKHEEDRKSSAPQLRAVAVVDDNFSKRHSDPLPEISHFDDVDISTIPLDNSSPKVVGRYREPSPPADATDAILTSIGARSSSYSQKQLTSPSSTSESSLTRLPTASASSSGTSDAARRAKVTSQRTGTSGSDGNEESARSFNASRSANYSFGSFDSGSQHDVGTPPKSGTRSNGLNGRSRRRNSKREKRALSPVASLDFVLPSNPSGAVHSDHFSQRYFGFSDDDSLTSPTVTNGARSKRGSASCTSTSGTMGLTGKGVSGTSLMDGSGSTGGSGFDWQNKPSLFGSAMLGSFAGTNEKSSTGLYPDVVSPTWSTAADDVSAYGATGLDSFLLHR